MSVVVRISRDPASRQLIAQRRRRPQQLRQELEAGLRQGLAETETHLIRNHLTGGDWRTPRSGRSPLAVRTGALRQSVTHDIDQPPYSGYIGTREGPASKYARMLLDAGSTTIRPKSANHLWIPIADNLNASGIMRQSPREVMNQVSHTGKRLARFFRSKRDNLVVFLADLGGGTYTRGKNKGRAKGKLMFVLKDSVTIQGTDALATSATQMSGRIGTIIGDRMRAVLTGETR